MCERKCQAVARLEINRGYRPAHVPFLNVALHHHVVRGLAWGSSFQAGLFLIVSPRGAGLFAASPPKTPNTTPLAPTSARSRKIHIGSCILKPASVML